MDDDAQSEPNIQTLGWSERYRTHRLTYDEKRIVCGAPAGSKDLPRTLGDEAQWWRDRRDNKYRDFNGSLLLCNGLNLTKIEKPALKLPDFYPLWVIQTDKNVIKDHNDFLTRQFADFVRQIYYTILREQDRIMLNRLNR